MKIYAIRHGLTESNINGTFNGHIDEDLASRGIEQAKELVPTVPKSIKHIYSSSLKRAKQTAEILNSETKVPISFHDELREVNMGIFNGQPFTEDRKKKHKSLQYDWSPQGGESMEDVKKRLLKVLKEIKSNNKDNEALIVAHGGIIRLLYFLEKGSLLDNIGYTLQIFDLDKIFEKYD